MNFYMALVFPTHVGVFPQIRPCLHWEVRLPHARGGVSPRSWQFGHSMFSLPHARGGVSNTWEWRETRNPVFPTHVGVFLIDKPAPAVGPLSSPRTWGCFSFAHRGQAH